MFVIARNRSELQLAVFSKLIYFSIVVGYATAYFMLYIRNRPPVVILSGFLRRLKFIDDFFYYGWYRIVSDLIPRFQCRGVCFSRFPNVGERTVPEFDKIRLSMSFECGFFNEV